MGAWRGQGWALASSVWPQVWLLCDTIPSLHLALLLSWAAACGMSPSRDMLGQKACGKSLVCLESYISHLTLSLQFWAGTQLQWFHCVGVSL